MSSPSLGDGYRRTAATGERTHAVHARHGQVRHDDVGSRLPQKGQGLTGVSRPVDQRADVSEVGAEDLARILVVINEQHVDTGEIRGDRLHR